MGKELGDSGSAPTDAEVMRPTVTAEIPNLLAEAERAGIPAHDLSTSAIDAWARRPIRRRPLLPAADHVGTLYASGALVPAFALLGRGEECR